MKRITLTLTLFLATVAATPLHAQISAFTYQGRLDLNGTPANGHYDFMFRLLNAPTNGVAAPVIPVNPAVLVTNGLFTTGMDFGAENFNGANRWLEINVRTNGGGAFTTLSPRQLLTPTPYAVTANTASNLLGTLPAGQISGTIPNASLPASPSFSGLVTASGFSGNGVNLTNVNATTLGGLSGSNFWRTTGNAGTTSGTHFLGTTDNQALEFRVNNLRVLRLEPNAASPNLVGGFSGNLVGVGCYGSVIGGGGSSGFNSTIFASWGVIAGGVSNDIGTNSSYSVIGGGTNNNIAANSSSATIAGGQLNDIGTDSDFGAVGGGGNNKIGVVSRYGAIAGGYANDIGTNADFNAIGGGYDNNATDNTDYATIAGGYSNYIDGEADASTIGGGFNNSIGYNSKQSTVAGGAQNYVNSDADYSVVGGGKDNGISINADNATIAGGFYNYVGNASRYSAIGGGNDNNISGNSYSATIAGGGANSISYQANYSTISGGSENLIAEYSSSATIAGGDFSSIGTNADFGTISGGLANRIADNSFCATIPGGYHNAATNYAFSAGRRAKASHQGAFVWGDSTDADIASTNANSVTMRASGGYRLFTDFTATTGAFLAAGSGSWTSMSDRNTKENFRATDAREVLGKVVALSMQTWNYKSQDASIRHIGPMAQDFKAAFGLGESDTGISNVDADGVALAAIQGLNQKLEESRAENAELKKRLTDLEQLVQKITPKTTQP